MKVYKYPVPIDDYFYLALPTGARVLHVEAQGDNPVLWALIDPDEEGLENRRFRLVGTGHPIDERPEELKHVSTFLMAEGRLVWHVFEIIN